MPTVKINKEKVVIDVYCRKCGRGICTQSEAKVFKFENKDRVKVFAACETCNK